MTPRVRTKRSKPSVTRKAAPEQVGKVELPGLLAERLAASPARDAFETALKRVQVKRATLPAGRRLALLVLLESATRTRPEANIEAPRIAEDHAKALRRPLEQALLGALFAADELEPGQPRDDLTFMVLPHLCDALDELDRRAAPEWKDARRGQNTARAVELSRQLRLQIRCSQKAADEIGAGTFGVSVQSVKDARLGR